MDTAQYDRLYANEAILIALMGGVGLDIGGSGAAALGVYVVTPWTNGHEAAKPGS